MHDSFPICLQFSTHYTTYSRRTKRGVGQNKILTDYDPNLRLCLGTDVFPYGLGAVFSHIMPNARNLPSRLDLKKLYVRRKEEQKQFEVRERRNSVLLKFELGDSVAVRD